MTAADAPTAPVRILLVEDDALFRETLTMNLEDAGFQVEAYPGSLPFLERLDAGAGLAAALLILDLEMPGPSGLQVLKRLQADLPGLPVIMLTSHGAVGYEDAAFAAGAVDFIDKARGFSILLHRIQRLLRLVPSASAEPPARTPATAETAAGAAETRRAIGRLHLVADTQRAYWDGEQVDLTVMEFRLVQFMAERAGQDLRYRTLYDQMRGSGFVAGSGEQGFRDNVRSAIRRVRQKFKAIDPDFAAIENYPGFGYRWSAN